MAARKKTKSKAKPKRPSFREAAGSAGVPRTPQGRPISTRKVTTKPVKTRKVTVRVVRNKPTGGRPQPKRGPDVPNPNQRRKGAVAQAAANANPPKPPTRLEQIVQQIKDDPIGFALDNPRKPIRQASLPAVQVGGIRQLSPTRFASKRQRKRRSAKVARRRRT